MDVFRDILRCASWHAFAGLTGWEIDEKVQTVERTLTFSQTNSENGYTSDEIEVDLEWGRYIVLGTDPPPEEEEYPEVYVPVPLDAKGDPVTRYIRVIGGGGLDKDEVGCPPEEPKPLGGNVTWEVKIMEKTTSDFNAEELTHGTLDTLDPDDEIPYLLLESTGLGTAKVTVTAPGGDDRKGATVFHFIKLCCVDEDDEVVWLAADVGSYLLNEVFNQESTMDLVDGMAFRFYYDGPNMDEERSVSVTGGDGAEHEVEFADGERTTKDRVIIYEDTVEALAGGAEPWFDGEEIVVIHNRPHPSAVPLAQITYDLKTGKAKVFGDNPITFSEWLQISKFDQRMTGKITPYMPWYPGPHPGVVGPHVTRLAWDQTLSPYVKPTGERRLQLHGPDICVQAEFVWRTAKPGGHVFDDLFLRRIRWYQMVEEGTCVSYSVRGSIVHGYYQPTPVADTYTKSKQYEVQIGLTPDCVVTYKAKKNYTNPCPLFGWLTAAYPTSYHAGLGTSEFYDKPGVGLHLTADPKLDWVGADFFFSTYLAITKELASPEHGICVVDAILKFKWSIKGLGAWRKWDGTWETPPEIKCWTTLEEYVYETGAAGPEIVPEDELLDVFKRVGDGWAVDTNTTSRPTGGDVSARVLRHLDSVLTSDP